MTTMQRFIRSLVTFWLVPSILGWCGIWLAVGMTDRWNEEAGWNAAEAAVTRYAGLVEGARCLENLLTSEFERLRSAVPATNAGQAAGLLERRFPERSLSVYLFDGAGRVVGGATTASEALVIGELFRFIRSPRNEPAALSASFPRMAFPMLYDGLAVAETLRGRPGRLLDFRHEESLLRDIPKLGLFDWRPGVPADRIAGVLAFVRPGRFEPETIPRTALAGMSIVDGFAGYLLPDGRAGATASASADLVGDMGKRFRRIPAGRFRYENRLAAARQVRGGIVLLAAVESPPGAGRFVPLAGLVFAAGSLLVLAGLYALSAGRLNPQVSVTAKLAGLFLLGLGFPLLVSLVLAGLYLGEKQAALLGEHRSAALTWLEKLDGGIEANLARRQRLYRRLCGRSGGPQPTPERLATVFGSLERASLLDAYEIVASSSAPLATSLYPLPSAFRHAMRAPAERRRRLLEIESAFDSRIETIQAAGLLGDIALPALEERRREEMRAHDDAVRSSMNIMTRAIMALHDRRAGANLDDKKAIAVLAGIDDSMLVIMNGSLYYAGQLIFSKGYLGDGYLYLDMITRPDGSAAFPVKLTHTVFSLQHEYLVRLFSSALVRHAGGRVIAVTDGEPFSPSIPDVGDRLRYRAISRELRTSGSRAVSRPLVVDGAVCDVTAVRGTRMKNLVWLHVTPTAALDRLLAPYRNRAAAFIAGTALFGLCAAYLLMRLFLVPVRDLSEGVRALRSRRFGHRVPVRRDDELGTLCAALNRTIGHMGEMEMAAAIQKTLLPGRDCAVGRLLATGRNRMTQAIGGDYYDYLPLADGRIAIVLGDVSGHGVSAALVTAMAKAAFTLLLPGMADHPDEVLRRINEQFLAMLRKKKMMSCAVLVLDPATGRGRLANAGQCSPVLADQRGAHPHDQPSHPLGCMKKPGIAVCNLDVPENGCIALHSDGLVEATDPEQKPVDYDRFYRFVGEAWSERATGADVISGVLDRVRSVTDPVPWADDATLVIISLTPGPG